MAQDGIRRRGGALYGELRKLELMRENGALTDDRYRSIRARLMRSVSDADLAEEVAKPIVAAPKMGAGTALTLGGAALAAVAMIGASPAALVWISLGGLATVALLACWEA